MIWVIRHSERTDQEAPELYKEHKKRFERTDPNQTPRGIDIAYQTGLFLKNQMTKKFPKKKIAIISSPFYRCIQTAVQVMKAITDKHQSSKTLIIEDAFMEVYSQIALLEPDTPQKLIYKRVLKGDKKQENAIFGGYDHIHNTMFDYDKPYPYVPNWEESLKECATRYMQRLQELSEIHNKQEFENTIFLVVSHGAFKYVAEKVLNTKLKCDYCSIYNFQIEKEITEDPKNQYKVSIPNGEQYAYDIGPDQDFKQFYIGSSIRCDNNDMDSHFKYVKRGLDYNDSPLTELGKEIALKTGKHLREELLSGKFPGKKKFLMVSSPYLRNIQTTKLLIDGFGHDLVHNNSIYVEDAFEEHYSEIAGINEDTRRNRTFNRFDYDKNLKREFIGDLNYVKNGQSSYEFEVIPMKLEWPESQNSVNNRYYYRISDITKAIERSPEYSDTLLVIVSHSCLVNVMEYFLGSKLDQLKPCSVTLLKKDDYGIKPIYYNKIFYSVDSVRKNSIQVEMTKYNQGAVHNNGIEPEKQISLKKNQSSEKTELVKKAVKTGKTSIEKRTAIVKRQKRRKFESYSIYIHKVLKNIHSNVGISKKAMNVMNSFVNDLFERVALEASKLARYHGKQTLSSHDIQCAVKLILPGDLADHAIAEGTKALNKFSASKY